MCLKINIFHFSFDLPTHGDVECRVVVKVESLPEELLIIKLKEIFIYLKLFMKILCKNSCVFENKHFTFDLPTHGDVECRVVVEVESLPQELLSPVGLHLVAADELVDGLLPQIVTQLVAEINLSRFCAELQRILGNFYLHVRAQDLLGNLPSCVGRGRPAE